MISASARSKKRGTLPMMELTHDQLAARKEKAVSREKFWLSRPSRGDRKGEPSGLYREATHQNQQFIEKEKGIMARGKTKADLEAEFAAPQEENQQLADQLDAIDDIVTSDDDDGTGDDDEEDEEEDEDLD
jgi:hypothetical protein